VHSAATHRRNPVANIERFDERAVAAAREF
jgi:hypothetical protein